RQGPPGGRVAAGRAGAEGERKGDDEQGEEAAREGRARRGRGSGRRHRGSSDVRGSEKFRVAGAGAPHRVQWATNSQAASPRSRHEVSSTDAVRGRPARIVPRHHPRTEWQWAREGDGKSSTRKRQTPSPFST